VKSLIRHATRTVGWALFLAIDRAWALIAGTAAVTVWATSEVGVNLYFSSGLLAEAVAIWYAATSAAIAVKPDEAWFHKIGSGLAVLFWGGRAAAFAELVIRDDRWDLTGAVVERFAVLAALLTLHFTAARRAARIQFVHEVSGVQINARS